MGITPAWRRTVWKILCTNIRYLLSLEWRGVNHCTFYKDCVAKKNANVANATHSLQRHATFIAARIIHCHIHDVTLECCHSQSSPDYSYDSPDRVHV